LSVLLGQRAGQQTRLSFTASLSLSSQCQSDSNAGNSRPCCHAKDTPYSSPACTNHRSSSSRNRHRQEEGYVPRHHCEGSVHRIASSTDRQGTGECDGDAIDTWTHLLGDVDELDVVLHVGGLPLVFQQLGRSLAVGLVLRIKCIPISQRHQQSFGIALALSPKVRTQIGSAPPDLQNGLHGLFVARLNEIGTLRGTN
jgi:hypothetical protein